MPIRAMDLAICGQQNLAVIRRRVAAPRGWWMECSVWKTASHICAGSRGGTEDRVETSLIKRAPPTAWEVMFIVQVVGVSMLAASGQNGWRWAFVWLEAITGADNAYSAASSKRGHVIAN
jgi:hypothetical protein